MQKTKARNDICCQNKYDINLSQSWLIGDKETDIIAANNAGISNTILVKSGHKINERETISKIVLASIKESQYIIN